MGNLSRLSSSAKAPSRLFAVALALASAGCGREARRAEPHRSEWVSMGTVAAVQWRGEESPDALEKPVKDVFSRLESLLNAHDPASEIRRLAPLADADILAKCDPSVRECYEAAFEMRRETGGAFDPRWRGEGTMDLGAIAKGYAVDLAAQRLSESGGLPAGGVLIDLGGNLKAVSGAWTVGIFGAEGERIVLEPGMAVATSGEYYRGRHIVDARTGDAPSNAVFSVSVVHPTSATLADALSTALFVLGREAGDRFIRERHPEARTVWRERSE